MRAVIVALALAPAAAQAAPVDVFGHGHAGRLVLLHGMGGDRHVMRASPFDRVVGGLTARGWQVIVPDLPYASTIPGRMAGRLHRELERERGARYRRHWERRFDHLVRWADRRYGRARRLYVGGFSWGGFHAMLAACHNRRVDGYFAHAPVVDPRALTEFQDLALGGLSLQSGCARGLAPERGLITYGGRDERVGTAPVQRLLATLERRHAEISWCDYLTLDHSTTPGTVENVLRWLDHRSPHCTRF